MFTSVSWPRNESECVSPCVCDSASACRATGEGARLPCTAVQIVDCTTPEELQRTPFRKQAI